jgi:hypothetical protein
MRSAPTLGATMSGAAALLNSYPMLLRRVSRMAKRAPGNQRYDQRVSDQPLTSFRTVLGLLGLRTWSECGTFSGNGPSAVPAASSSRVSGW